MLPLLGRARTAYAYDLRGHGETRTPGGDFSLAAHAADLLALADALAPGQRLHVLGTSLGGVVVQLAAAAAPGRFASLVLACTWAAAPEGLDADGLAQAVEAAPDVGVHFAGVVRAMLPDHPDEAALLLAAIAAADRAALVQGVRELFSYDGRARLATIAAPALVLCGAHDDRFPYAAARVIADGLRDARVGVLARSGHAPYLDCPGAFVAAVTEFWKAQATEPGLGA